MEHSKEFKGKTPLDEELEKMSEEKMKHKIKELVEELTRLEREREYWENSYERVRKQLDGIIKRTLEGLGIDTEDIYW